MIDIILPNLQNDYLQLFANGSLQIVTVLVLQHLGVQVKLQCLIFCGTIFFSITML